MFSIVQFLRGKEYDVIPNNWIVDLNKDKTFAFWPHKNALKKVQRQAEFNPEWEQFGVVIIKRNIDGYATTSRSLYFPIVLEASQVIPFTFQ